MKTYVEEIAEGTYRLETQIPGLNTVFSVYFIKDKSFCSHRAGAGGNYS